MEQTSSGDSLDAKFRAGSSSHSSADSSMGGEGVDDLWSAVQQGHVSMMRRAPAKSGAKANAKAGGQGNAQQDVVRAGAERAAYDGDLDRVTLSGGVQVSDADSVLWANQVALDRATGDARAVGAVKVNYLRDDTQQAGGVQGGGSHAVPGDGLQQVEPAVPTHILAERADLEHASGVATFYGRPVRLWQGGSQVQAPVIELSRAQQRLIARGEASAIGAAAAQTAQVHTVLLSAGSDASGTAKVAAGNAGTGKAAARLPEVVRIASGGLVYSGVLRQAEFGGGVRAETVDGAIRASQATVYLRQAAGPVPSSAGDAVPSLEGDVERMVATGQIEIEQPGRRATGERLVYTASDRLFVLTGDGKVQPKLVDAAHGTITGAALQFHSGDDSVVVSNVVPGATGAAAGQRVRTETHTGKDATMGKGK